MGPIHSCGECEVGATGIASHPLISSIFLTESDSQQDIALSGTGHFLREGTVTPASKLLLPRLRVRVFHGDALPVAGSGDATCATSNALRTACRARSTVLRI